MTKTLFSANDGTHGIELWVTDGTPAGTSLLLDINNTGSASSSPANFVAVGLGQILFRATDGVHGSELWVTDGTPAGTSMMLDINSGSASSTARYFTKLSSGKVLFQASDGTTAGLHGTELWVTDGTTAGTSLLKDINTSSTGASSNPKYIALLGNGTAVFQANDGTTSGLHGVELWVTDGTSAGTSMVQDMNPGTLSSTPKFMTAIGNGKALFQAADATHGSELWITNGTSAGTSMLLDIRSGATSSAPKYFIPLGNGKTVFRATDGTHGYELWVTDGTTGGTSMVKDINNSGSASANPVQLFSLGNGKVLFEAADSTHGAELWITDGTASGTSMLSDINPGANSSFPQAFAALGNGNFLFQANDGTHGYELWVTDGTGAGTSMVMDIFPGSAANSGNPAYFTSIGNGQALFQATDGNLAHGTELWITDGTAAGTSLVKDINATAVGASASPANLVVAVACFLAGTRMLTDIGDLPVEDLRPGQRVKTENGFEPIIWIGRRRLDLKRHADPRSVHPVRIRRDTFSEGVPARDLLLSPDHAILIDDGLVEVKRLINGVTIAQEFDHDTVEYFHVELARHAILVAEGLNCESYLDTGNRARFENGGPVLQLHPRLDGVADQQRREAGSCKPLISDARRLEPIWRRLSEQASLKGPPPPETSTITADKFFIRVNDRDVRAISRAGERYIFMLPPGATRIHLISEAAEPIDFRPWLGDRRMLGVSVRRILVHDRDGPADISLDNPALADGWWTLEDDSRTAWRWTNGNAALWLPRRDLLMVEIHLAGSVFDPVAADLSAPLALARA